MSYPCYRRNGNPFFDKSKRREWIKVRDLLIIGAGPAGLNAAIAAAKHDLRVKVIDEFPKVGGRLLGQLHEESKDNWWNGIVEAEKLEQKARSLGVEIECGVSVYDLRQTQLGWTIYSSQGTLESNKLLIATGATEVPNPVPGWTTPGSLSIGAAQVMGNVHRVKPGNTCIVIGTNVLSVAIANELRLNGVDVKGIILPPKIDGLTVGSNPTEVMESLMNLTHLAPSAILRSLGKLAKFVPASLATTFYPKSGVKIFDIPIKIKTAAVEIIDDGKKVTGVKTVNVDNHGKVIAGSEQMEEVDFVCISGGLAPLPELAALTGCTFKYVPELGGHIPFHSERMETKVPHLYLAGNITGVESAKVAMAQGTVAGLVAAQDLIGPRPEMETEIEAALFAVKKTRKEALIQFQPGIEEAREMIYEEFNNDNGQLINQLSAL